MHNPNNTKSGLRTLLQYLIIIFITLGIAYLIIEYFHPIVISGNSMEPTLQSGSVQVSTNSFKANDVEKGDIVVFFYNGVQFVKRVVAIPGDEIWIENKVLYVNGEISPYQFDEIENAGILKEHIFLHAEEYFCIGDNRNESMDCREIGVISFEQIKYKIILNKEMEIKNERYK